VRLDRAETDEEGVGHLFVGTALSQQAQHVTFARGQT
jgi:hypothetical protein